MSYVGNKPAQKTIPVDDSVTTAMLKDDAVTSAKIDDLTIVNADINASAAIANSKMATDTTNASNLASGTVPTARLGSGSASSSTFLTGAQTYAAVDTSGITANKDDIALLGFKVAANGSLAKYNLVDQTIDAFEDASGIDASASTNENRDSSGYYSGTAVSAYTVSAFTSTGAATWTCPANTTEAEVLIVAGGGGGCNEYYAGGGGAGGIVHDEDYAVTAGVVYDLSVGAGGAKGVAGSDTVWNVNAEGSGITMTANGGGRGGGSSGSGSAQGGSGGSGGGDDNDATGTTGGSSTQTSPTGAVGYGSAGGGKSSMGEAGGGGGGATETPGQTSPYPPGNASNGITGGAGKLFSNFTAYGTTSANVASSGSDGGYFGGGGGGGAYTGTSGSLGGIGGVGGGGKGGGYGSGQGATAGLANTGGGGGSAGGGHESGDSQGDPGGSGVLLIRHRSEVYADMTLISNATTAQDGAPTTGDLVITYTDGAGTATVNTDIKAYISRDGSAYTSAVTLVSQGTTGGHKILTANGVDLSGIASGTSMRYKITTHNQSASKDTRIQAVSLGWS